MWDERKTARDYPAKPFRMSYRERRVDPLASPSANVEPSETPKDAALVGAGLSRDVCDKVVINCHARVEASGVRPAHTVSSTR